MKDRHPVVAGTFYPSDPTALRRELEFLFRNASRPSTGEIAALIVPHAGYVFSGEVAAAAYSLLHQDAVFDNVFLIGTSHRKTFSGVSIYPSGHFVTPLGSLPVNAEITGELMHENHFIYFDQEAEIHEHTLEVQLPFMQYRLKSGFKIIPILIGLANKSICSGLAEALRPWFTANNLFVFSSDFSHYPSSADAETVDGYTIDMIIKNDAGVLQQYCREILTKDICNLSTALCGESAIMTLQYLTHNGASYQYQKLLYRNSGQAPFGEAKRVVGYWAVSVIRQPNVFLLSDLEKDLLLKLARKCIVNAILNEDTEIQEEQFPEKLLTAAGAFVSVYHHNKLRGCLGHIESHDPLWKLVAEMAVATAQRDYRFDPITEVELNDLEIEISILSTLRKIRDYREIILGKHGIFMRKGSSTGIFLPQVALKTNWSAEEFLGYCARDKAHIGWDGWKNAELYTFEAIVFKG